MSHENNINPLVVFNYLVMADRDQVSIGFASESREKCHPASLGALGDTCTPIYMRW